MNCRYNDADNVLYGSVEVIGKLKEVGKHYYYIVILLSEKSMAVNFNQYLSDNLPTVTQNPLHNVIRPWTAEHCQWNCSCTTPTSK